MCYSAESSISNYTYVTIVSLFLYFYGDKYDKHISFFTFVVGQIQLAEYFMWKDQKCGMMNKLATLVARFLLFLQPLSIILGGYLFKTMNTSNYILVLSLLYILFFFITSLSYFLKNNDICSVDKYGHLQWDFFKNIDQPNILNHYINIFYFLVFLFYWLLLKNKNLGIFISILSILAVLFHFIQYPENYQWTTLWCYHVSVGITVYIMARLVDYKYKIF